MNRYSQRETGFTLIEIAIVLLIVGVLLGYTVALFPKQQELKQYRAASEEMDEIIEAIIGFSQVNGRLPCPAIPNSLGIEDGGGTIDCNNYGGFVPVNTLGISGRLNGDSLLIDPWGNPYRYYVSSSDASPGAVGTNGIADFVRANEMRTIGLVDIIDVANNDLSGDTYLDLDGQFLICDAAGTTTDDVCTGANTVFGRDAGIAVPGPYAGAPFVLISHGKNWNQIAAAGDELENMGALATPPAIQGPTATAYLLKNVAAGQTTFVKRLTGASDNFDDIVKWVSPNILFSKMIEAGQLP